MDVDIRPARPEDKAAIADFTRDTFEWGDYVTDVFEDWLEDPDGLVLAAEDPEGRAVAMAKGTLLSPIEAWAQGARVHPDFRRQGIGKRLNDALCAWAAERGARVMRLLVEDWNGPARNQVLQLSYRPVSGWVMAERPVGEAAPQPAGNGGRRVPTAERLQRAPSSEAEPAYLAWIGGELAKAARELLPIGWIWRRCTAEDLAEAARRGELWEARPGWALGTREEDTFRVSWLTTGPEDAYALARALVDRAIDSGAERLEVMAPRLAWLEQALRRAGTELHPMTVYAKPLSGRDGHDMPVPD